MKRKSLKLKLVQIIERDRMNDYERLDTVKLVYNVIKGMEMLCSSSFGTTILGLTNARATKTK